MNEIDKIDCYQGICDGWHDWNCPNTRCNEHPEFKLFDELDKED